MKKNLILAFTFISLFFLCNASADDYPNTSIAIIDINEILNNSKVAINANEQIEEISIKVQENLAAKEKELIDEQKKGELYKELKSVRSIDKWLN